MATDWRSMKKMDKNYDLFAERLLKALDEAERYERCEKCPYLASGDAGELICDNCGIRVINISDEECPVPNLQRLKRSGN